MHQNKLTFLLLFLLALLLVLAAMSSLAAPQKVYVYKDKNGDKVFSDQPHPGAKEVKFNSKTMTMPTTDTGIFGQLRTQGDAKPLKYQLSVNQPEDQATIRDNGGVVNISGQVSPTLKFGQKVQLKLDGQIVQKPHSNVIFVLRDINRGEHTIMLELLSPQGKVIASSKPRTFYLFRASVLHNQQ
jgi:hypothetical protein